MALIDHQRLIDGGQNEFVQNVIVNDGQISIGIDDLGRPINDLERTPRAPHLQLA